MEKENNTSETKVNSEEEKEPNKGQEDERDAKILELEKSLKDKDNIISGVVEELKELRVKKGTEEPSKAENEDEVSLKVSKILQEEKSKESKANKEKALEIFYKENKEFHPENDIAGLRFKLIEKELEDFNLSKAQSVDDYLKFLNKALNQINASKKENKETTVHIDPNIPKEEGNPESKSPNNLSSKELKIMKQAGWTEEKYLKLKSSQPTYIRSLMDAIPD